MNDTIKREISRALAQINQLNLVSTVAHRQARDPATTLWTTMDLPMSVAAKTLSESLVLDYKI